MNIAILGLGLEGQSIKRYFSQHQITTFDHFKPQDLASFKLSEFDLVFRSPSVPVQPNLIAPWTSLTRYFFDHCPAPIIGVTGTKGKGTTSSLIQALLNQIGAKTWLLGNVGSPALDYLDQIKASDIVIYEMSSFQLWDLEKSPKLAVVLRIEPDHLDVHRDFRDYLTAKSHITKYQTPEDSCIYYHDNPHSTTIANLTPGQKLPYPPGYNLKPLLSQLAIPGRHNQENASAALLTVATFYRQTLDQFIHQYQAEIITAFQNFTGLPHRLELVRELNQVRYYDDNYSSAYPALDVALTTFEHLPTILIAGGKDRHLDLSKMRQRIFSAKNLHKVILIGETKHQLSQHQNPDQFILADDLKTAVTTAQNLAENIASASSSPAVVLMSPGAASFDMFKNFSDRGNQFQNLVRGLK